jgi:hypothetical protein
LRPHSKKRSVTFRRDTDRQLWPHSISISFLCGRIPSAKDLRSYFNWFGLIP